MAKKNGDACADVMIVGGGLAGLVAAYRLAHLAKKKVVLIDSPLREADGELGGFAKFSGAKFSLPPAGLGLIPIAGSRAKLERACDEVIEFLGLNDSYRAYSNDLATSEMSVEIGSGLSLRRYESIVLTPREIASLIARLEGNIRDKVTVIRGVCASLSKSVHGWTGNVVINSSESTIEAACAVVAAGRGSSIDLSALGAVPTKGKGIDVGFRIEFFGDELIKLREIGPDAKLIMGDCRTFCLNVPGRIFGHSFRGITIPGGIVADADTKTSNVGVLCRLDVNRLEWLHGFFGRISEIDFDVLSPISSKGSRFESIKRVLQKIYGDDVAEKLVDFLRRLGSSGFVNWEGEHYYHFPLLDWYWSTFSQEGSFSTSLPSLYVIGDQSGHARGLLQAAVSGWLLAEQIDA